MTVDRRNEGSAVMQGAASGTGGERWREVVRLLEDNARARTRLEAVETALLREARACDVPARLGYVSMEEFAERHLGYGRHAANERCRVSLELAALPQLCAAYEDGTLMFSHVRELTRVATPQTEGAYLAAAAGKTSRQVQQLVSGKRAGDAPDAPPDPALVKHILMLELGGEAFAMWRRAQQVLEDEVGERLSPDELVMQLCTQALTPELRDDVRGDEGGGVSATSSTDDTAVDAAQSRGTTEVVTDEAEAGAHHRSRGTDATPPISDGGEPGSHRSRGTDATPPTTDEGEPGSRRSRGTGTTTPLMTEAHAAAPPQPRSTRSRSPRVAPPPTLHAVTTCRSCQRATASAVGSAEPLTAAQRDRALCDAIHVGDLETSDLSRPTLSVPSAIRRKVAIASNHACVVPGCRSRRHLTIHHLRYQAHGGIHTVENCVLACHLCRARHK